MHGGRSSFEARLRRTPQDDGSRFFIVIPNIHEAVTLRRPREARPSKGDGGRAECSLTDANSTDAWDPIEIRVITGVPGGVGGARGQRAGE